jgi:hypothetical protein
MTWLGIPLLDTPFDVCPPDDPEPCPYQVTAPTPPAPPTAALLLLLLLLLPLLRPPPPPPPPPLTGRAVPPQDGEMRIEFEVAMVGLIAGSAAPIAAPIAAPNGHPPTTQHLSRTHLAPSSVPFPLPPPFQRR